jgi:flagellar biosynthesis protein
MAEPKKRAIALEYDPDKVAPKVIASGEGFVADAIIRKAKEIALPIYKDPDLIQAMNLLRIGDEIPAELYTVVAQILIFVGAIDKKNPT